MTVPTLDQRLALRERPSGPAVMRQRWSRLLFLHWRVDPAWLEPHLPDGLHLDRYRDDAWLGIVPFYMERIRPIGLPPLPGLSWFLELNVRSYVHDDRGVPGVWFFSLDCNQPLAVKLARSLFHLAYQHADMSADSQSDRSVHYTCRRRDQAQAASYRYRADGEPAAAEPGGLEFFLAERYLLYSASPDGRLHSGRVHHAPYRLAPAHCPEWSVSPAHWNDIPLAEDPPESALFAEGVDVSVFPLRRHA